MLYEFPHSLRVALVDNELDIEVVLGELALQPIESLGEAADPYNGAPNLVVMNMVRERGVSKHPRSSNLVPHFPHGAFELSIIESLNVRRDLTEPHGSRCVCKLNTNYVQLSLLSWSNRVVQDELTPHDIVKIAPNQTFTWIIHVSSLLSEIPATLQSN
jgi:hypothetical protein